MSATPPAPDSVPGSDAIPTHQLKWRAVGGVVWLVSGTGVLALIKLPVVAILARLLSPAEFGVVAAAGTIIWLSAILSDLGVGAALVQRRDLTSAHVRTAVTSAWMLGLALAGVIALAAPLIAAFFRMPPLEEVMRVLAIAFPLVSLSGTAERLLQRRMRFRAIAAVDVVAYGVGYGAVGIALALLGAGVWSLVAAEMTKSLLRAAAFLRLTPDDKRIAFDPAAFRELLRFGAGYTLGIIFMYAALSGDNLIVGRVLGAAALGIYSRAYDIMVIPTSSLGRVLVRVLFPALARLQDDRPQLRLAYRRGLALVGLLVLPVSAMTIVLAPEIIATLLGPQWSAAVLPLRILAVGIYFQVAQKVADGVITATGAVYRAAWRNGVYAAMVVGGALVGQLWGLPGVAAGVVVAIITNFATLTHLGMSLTHLSGRELLRAHVPALLWSVLLGATALAVAFGLRQAAMAPVATLVVAGGLPIIVALLTARVVSLRLLGADGVWLARTLQEHAPARLRPAIRVLFGGA